MTDELLYVYTVLRSAPPPSPPLALDARARLGRGLGLVEYRGLAAVVEPVEAVDFDEEPLRAHLEDLDWLADVARAHHDVVAHVGHRTTTVPLRLATLCRGRSGVRRMLADAYEVLGEALERVTDAEEWGVKLYAQPAAQPASPDTPPAESGPGAAPAPSGRDYLRRRLAHRRAEADRTGEARRAAEALHQRLTGEASGAVLHPPQQQQLSQAPGQNVLNAAYLVPTAHRQAFLDRVPAADDLPPGVRVEVTGPWVPYSFTHTTAPAPSAEST
ncbi:GvpL/GvpF family gas vesicle protein [Streptomyces sp. A1136]|uniref:GvpL/GvpF family gas vesicle protein n=1 Tax=Streptomyces sp. A1136 TaxID=2563102 RepID=UPI00109E37D2|nr:GvpL/GvpF family gas vesicle protein [Streptomyces sp. A1136]THA51398.1 GvpL/GvpF family gas vesicle protein [Streptomyces sp. A1136]